MDHLRFIEKVTRHRIARKPLPSLAEAIEGKQRLIAERLLETIRSNGEEVGPYKWLAVQLLEQHDSVQLLAAALKMLGGERKDVHIELTPEDPVRTKKRKFDGRPDAGGGVRRYGQGTRSGGARYGGYREGGRGRRDDRWQGGGERDRRRDGDWHDGSRGRGGPKPENKAFRASEDYVNI